MKVIKKFESFLKFERLFGSLLFGVLGKLLSSLFGTLPKRQKEIYTGSLNGFQVMIPFIGNELPDVHWGSPFGLRDLLSSELSQVENGEIPAGFKRATPTRVSVCLSQPHRD